MNARTETKGTKMKRSSILAGLVATACLTFAPGAQASIGDHFSFAPTTDVGTSTSAPAFPGEEAFWAGTCDMEAASPAVGTPPANFAHCIDHNGGSNFSIITPPFAKDAPVIPGGPFAGGWGGGPLVPSWRLQDESAAAAHPDGSGSFWLSTYNQEAEGAFGIFGPPSDGALRGFRVSLPPGVVGNPTAVPKCPAELTNTVPTTCPSMSQVGVATVTIGNHSTTVFPIYNVEARDGKVAELIASGVGVGTTLTSNIPSVAEVRTEGDFGVDAFSIELPSGLNVTSTSFTLWGVPWAKSHDRYRPIANYCGNLSGATLGMEVTGLPGGFGNGCSQAPQSYQPSWGPIRPFFSTQTDCSVSDPATSIRATNWHTSVVASAKTVAPQPTGCANVPFDAEITLDPEKQGGALNQEADSPSGLDVELRIPQNNDLPFNQPPSGAPQVDIDQYVADATAYWKSDQGLATSHLRDTVISLPEGLALNPSAAAGQGVCTMAQIGVIDTDNPVPPTVRFNNDDPSDGKGQECPEAAKIATVTVDAPLLDETDDPTGEVYLAAQGANPFGSDFAIYIALRSPQRGLVAKLAGKVEPDPVTGRLKTTFAGNPQVPVESFKLHFKAGPHAPLATPVTCGAHTSVNSFTPYSTPDKPVVVNDSFDITTSPAGGCAVTKEQRPLNVGFSAGSTELVAGAHSPFTVRITRPDGNQELDRIEVTTPEGLAAKLAGVPYCSEASIAQAISRTATGDGAKEIAGPSCPAASQVGTTTIGAGAGSPFFVGGKIYLAGPYKGAPVSMAFIVPAVAGPFDLGVQVVRTALQINPKTAQVTAVSDTIPKILAGVPLRIRDVRVDINRPGFTLNPTDCSEQLVTGEVSGASGAVVNLSNRFQIAECARLGFKPRLKLQLFGGTKRGKYQRLKAVVTARPGDANIARAAVTLPHSEFLAQEHINTVCTRVQFAADQCPAGAIYGKATAISPLLDQPLTGPVYLRSSDNPLPDLVAALKGPDNQPIEIELSGRTDSKNEGIRNTFDVVPDAAVSKFTLEMMGGRKSLIVNSTDICNGVHKADVKMDGQNGRAHNFKTKVTNPACGKAKKGKNGKKKAKAHKRTVASRTLADLAGGLF